MKLASYSHWYYLHSHFIYSASISGRKKVSYFWHKAIKDFLVGQKYPTSTTAKPVRSLLLTHNAPAHFAPARSDTGITCFFASTWQVKRSIHNSSVCPAQSQRISWASWPSLGNLLPKRLIFSTTKFVSTGLVCTTWIGNRWSRPMRSKTDAGFL